MTETQTLKALQLFYAGALVDAVRQYEAYGILEQVTGKKKAEQEISAHDQVARLGITNSSELFLTFSEIFGCAKWTMQEDGSVTRATSTVCLACAIAKKLGAPSPCSISCINPMTGLAAALPAPKRLTVKETLWDGKACVFEMEEARHRVGAAQ